MKNTTKNMKYVMFSQLKEFAWGILSTKKLRQKTYKQKKGQEFLAIIVGKNVV